MIRLNYVPKRWTSNQNRSLSLSLTSYYQCDSLCRVGPGSKKLSQLQTAQGSKYSAQHSRSSVLLIPRSYVIHTVQVISSFVSNLYCNIWEIDWFTFIFCSFDVHTNYLYQTCLCIFFPVHDTMYFYKYMISSSVSNMNCNICFTFICTYHQIHCCRVLKCCLHCVTHNQRSYLTPLRAIALTKRRLTWLWL